MREIMDKVNYNLNYQAVVNCPKCGQLHVEDLYGAESADGIEIDCICGYKFELGED
jgi:hypothetical protein